MLRRSPIFVPISASVALLAALCLTFCPHQDIDVTDVACVTADGAHGAGGDKACHHESPQHSHDHDCCFEKAHSHEFCMQQREVIVPGPSLTLLCPSISVRERMGSAECVTPMRADSMATGRLLVSVVLRV